MRPLESYGKVFRQYTGSGLLELGGSAPIECRFELVQTVAGRLVALCERDDRKLYLSPSDAKGALKGAIDDGRLLRFEDVSVLRSNAQSTYSDSREVSSSHAILSGNEVTVRGHTETISPVMFVFALTNLTLLGTDSFVVTTPDGGEHARRQQGLILGQETVVLRPLADHEEIMRELKASRGVDVSCELLVEAASAKHLDAKVELASDLCLLLTLAMGCRVEWLCYDVIDSGGDTAKSYHRNAITKRWGPLPLIPELPPQDLKYFLERTYARLHEVEKDWGFRDAVSAYTDGKQEGDFIEFRALKLAVTMEYLVGRFLAKTGGAQILASEDFEAKLGTVIQETQQILAATFPDATADQVEMMANHVRGFNWYTFRRALSDICNHLCLKINSKERGRFKAIRDELVHRASFDSEYGTHPEQYLFMMTFIGKILLGILGYDGYYYDWTKPRGWIGEDMEMRVKLDLESERRTLSEAERQ